MNGSYEYVSRDLPFTVHRRVRWSECDPAGVVYAGRFTDYLLDACGLFSDHIGYGHGARTEFGLPAKHLSLTFMASLYPDDAFDLEISVGEIRNRTFDLLATAKLADGRTAFEGQCTLICIAPHARESILIPQGLRERLTPYLSGKEPKI